MTTFIRGLSWSALLASLFLLSVAVRAQSATRPNPVLAMYTPDQHLGLGWERSPAGSVAVAGLHSAAIAQPALLDLRIGRPTPYAMGVVLYWTSTNERPATQFIVERRDDGQANYRPVAVLPGYGAGQEMYSYSFVDDGNTAASSYRLRQVCAAECLNQLSAAQVVPGATVAPPEPRDNLTAPRSSPAID